MQRVRGELHDRVRLDLEVNVHATARQLPSVCGEAAPASDDVHDAHALRWDLQDEAHVGHERGLDLVELRHRHREGQADHDDWHRLDFDRGVAADRDHHLPGRHVEHVGAVSRHVVRELFGPRVQLAPPNQVPLVLAVEVVQVLDVLPAHEHLQPLRIAVPYLHRDRIRWVVQRVVHGQPQRLRGVGGEVHLVRLPRSHCPDEGRARLRMVDTAQQIGVAAAAQRDRAERAAAPVPVQRLHDER